MKEEIPFKSKWTPPEGQFASLDFFIKKCRHDINKPNFNRTTKFSNLSSEERVALENLSKRKDLIVKAADKGGALVVWWADLYQKEALRQLSDTSFYAKVDKDLTSTNQQIINSTINDLIVKQELPATASNLIITTPRTSWIYFLPKIHKPNNPGRPIVSACSCPTELISSYLAKLWHLSSDLYRHTLKTVNTRFKFFAISISWAKTNLFSLWILHLFTPSSLMAKVF